MPRYKRGPAPRPDYKVLTKLQLIKKLKADDNFNYEFGLSLNADSDYIYERGSVYDIYSLSDRGQEGAYSRIDKVIHGLMEEFPETLLERTRKLLASEILDDVKYSNILPNRGSSKKSSSLLS